VELCGVNLSFEDVVSFSHAKGCRQLELFCSFLLTQVRLLADKRLLDETLFFKDRIVQTTIDF